MREEDDPYLNGTWVVCQDCEDFWCIKHEQHVYDCACPGFHD